MVLRTVLAIQRHRNDHYRARAVTRQYDLRSVGVVRVGQLFTVGFRITDAGPQVVQVFRRVVHRKIVLYALHETFDGRRKLALELVRRAGIQPYQRRRAVLFAGLDGVVVRRKCQIDFRGR